MEPLKKMKAPSGLQDFSVCQNELYFLAVVYDTVCIYNTDFQSPIISIKLDSTPLSAKLSQCGKIFYIHTDNIIYLYSTCSGTIIQKIFGAPLSTKTIKFSKNSQKLIYGNTQMLCLWNIKKCSNDVRTQFWKNINVYDLNQDGSQFALGTYNGIIYVIEFIEAGRCNQIQIKRHKTSVESMCFHKNQIISASNDGLFVISTIVKDINGDSFISYNSMRIKNIPKQMQSIGENFYMYSYEGMTWFNHHESLAGFTDYKKYKPFVNAQGKVIFVTLFSGEMEWWPADVFKTLSEIQREKANRQKMKKEKKKQMYISKMGKQNQPRCENSAQNKA